MIINTSPEPWATFERWLVNHGWPDIDQIEVPDLLHAIGLYYLWDEATEPSLNI